MKTTLPKITLDHARELLTHVDADCDRQDWIALAGALKTEFGDDGFGPWHDWSLTCADDRRRATPTQIRAEWRGVKADKFRIGTLVHHAKRGGWQPKKDGKQPTPVMKPRPRPAPEPQQAPRIDPAQAALQLFDVANKLTLSECQHPYIKAKQLYTLGTDVLCCVVTGDDVRNAGYKKLQSKDGPLDLNGPLLIHGIYQMQNGKPRLSTAELIDRYGRKSTLPGQGRRRGGFLAAGRISAGRIPENQAILLVEGWATAATLQSILGRGVLVIAVFSVGNFSAVAAALGHLKKQLIIASDCGKNGGPHPQAVKAAAENGTGLVWPQSMLAPGTDFNDLYCRRVAGGGIPVRLDVGKPVYPQAGGAA